MRGLRVLGQDQLQVIAQGRFNRGKILIGNTNPVGERTEHGLRLFEGGQRAGTESFMTSLQLLQHIQAGSFLRVLLQAGIQFLSDLIQFLSQLAQALLPFFDGPATGFQT